MSCPQSDISKKLSVVFFADQSVVGPVKDQYRIGELPAVFFQPFHSP